MNRIARTLRGFAAFWWDFVVGDDWRIAAGVLVAFAATAGLAGTSVPAWWVVPVAAAAMLSLSLWRASRSVKDQSK
ncbi:MAG: hypothetical protein QOC66_3386 [Pseudonocardiales bacterium]|jgi:hypothetical protein|nr:hypothetical protein [Pseudonocardiales bacterium]